jgi:LPS sulfotransferase NodH
LFDAESALHELPGLEDLSFSQALDADKVARAVSLCKAIQTEQWRGEEEVDSGESERPAEYFRALNPPRRRAPSVGRCWEDWFSRRQPRADFV